MLDRFLTALLYELLSAEKSGLPKVLKEYTAEVSDAEFMADIRLLTAYLTGRSGLRLNESKLLKAVAVFITENLATKVDKVGIDFYRQNSSDQQKQAEELIKSDTLVAKTLKELFCANSYQELAQGLADFVAAVTGAPYILVQTPREADQALKQEIRTAIREKHGQYTFPIFQINRNLIGGLRVFIDGDVTDHSWLGRINYITNLK